MSIAFLSLIVLGLAALGWLLGRQRALAATGGDARQLHSLPSYYGASVFLFTAVPAFLAMALWLLVQPVMVDRSTSAMITAADVPQGSSHALVMADVRRIAAGLDILIARGMDEGTLATMRADLSDIRGRLGGVGVAVAPMSSRPPNPTAALPIPGGLPWWRPSLRWQSAGCFTPPSASRPRSAPATSWKASSACC